MRITEPVEIKRMTEALKPWMHFDEDRDRFWPREETPPELMSMWMKIQQWYEEQNKMKLESPVY